MCRVSVTCCCDARGGSSGGLAPIAVGVLVLLVVAALPAALQAVANLLTAVVTGIGIAAGVVVLGWALKLVAEKVADAWSLRHHNKRMTRVHAELHRVHRRATSVSAIPPVVESRRPRAIAGPQPVQIYPTPRAELHAQNVRRSGDQW